MRKSSTRPSRYGSEANSERPILVLRGNAELGWFDADVAAAYLQAIDVKRPRRAVKGYGHMMPAAGWQRRSPVDELLGATVFDPKTDDAGEAFCGVRYMYLSSQNRVEVRIQLVTESRFTQAATVTALSPETTPCRQCNILIRSAQIHCVAFVARHPSGAARQCAVPAFAGHIVCRRSACFVKRKLCNRQHGLPVHDMRYFRSG